MNIADITSGSTASPADLIDLEESLSQPPPPRVAAVRWAFRGQSQAYGTLAPSFQRIFKEKRSIGAAEIIERDLIQTFRTHYAKLKGRTDDMPQPNSIDQGFDLRCLSVMQHYGVPTRLLDWTSDFWTAVYFACAGDPAKEAELWMYNREIFHSQLSSPDLGSLLLSDLALPEPDLLSLRGRNLIVELDTQTTPRMREQHAHHTLSSDVFADHVPLLLDLAKLWEPRTAPNTPFRRVLIEAGCKEKALRFLEGQKQLTAGTIFPDVEGLGKFLHWHLESLVTTLL
jgi:FRG domain-containing protein